MSNYFADLRSEVDIAFIKMNQTEQSIEVKHKLNDSWFQMIESVNTFETECFKLRSTNSFNLDFSQEVREKIELINIILNDLTNQINSTKITPNFKFINSVRIHNIINSIVC